MSVHGGTEEPDVNEAGARRGRRLVATAIVVALIAAFTGAFAITAAARRADAAASLSVTTTTLPAGTVGASYSATLQGSGGTPPYHWQLAFTPLPPGLNLNTATGVISGRPTAGGVYPLLLALIDAATPNANTAFRMFTLTVGPTRVFVANSSTNSVTGYALGANGNATPITTLAGPHTGLNGPVAVALDGSGRLYVANAGNDTVTVYGTFVAGDAAPFTTLAAGNGIAGPRALAVDDAGRLYVSNQDNTTITEYLWGSASNAQPVATIAGPHTGLSLPAGLTVDGTGRLVVAEARLNRILTFASGASGDATPVSTISGSNTGLSVPTSVAFDSSGNLWVGNATVTISGPGNLVKFAAGASGNVAPIAKIAGTATKIAPVIGVASDGAGHVLAVDGTNHVLQFPTTANGNVAPSGELTGAATGLGNVDGIAVVPAFFVNPLVLDAATLGRPYQLALQHDGGVGPITWTVAGGALPPGITLSKTGNFGGTPTVAGRATFTLRATDAAVPADVVTHSFTLDVSVQPLVYAANTGNDTVTAYQLGALGDASPVLTVGGTATGLGSPTGLAFDALGTLYVANNTAAPAGSVTVYAPGANGNVAPVRTIAGSNTGILAPKAVALDPAGRIYVANQLANTVTIYAHGANGNVAPVAKITGVSNPSAVTIDGAGRAWVGDATDTVKVYPAGITGTVSTPLATLGGANTGISGISGLVFESTGRLDVSNQNAHTITTYAPGATGNVKPLTTITNVVLPYGLDVDSNDDLYVALSAGGATSVQPFTAAKLPLGSITGGATGLNQVEAVAVLPPLSIRTTRVPDGKVGRAYRAQLEASLGTTPYTWRVTGGALPPGLALTRDGLLSGTPNKGGRFVVQVEVTDSTIPAMSDAATFVLKIDGHR
jgi:6-phosphogluconolactonase (cycloisomerase 2 family)